MPPKSLKKYKKAMEFYSNSQELYYFQYADALDKNKDAINIEYLATLDKLSKIGDRQCRKFVNEAKYLFKDHSKENTYFHSQYQTYWTGRNDLSLSIDLQQQARTATMAFARMAWDRVRLGFGSFYAYGVTLKLCFSISYYTIAFRLLILLVFPITLRVRILDSPVSPITVSSLERTHATWTTYPLINALFVQYTNIIKMKWFEVIHDDTGETKLDGLGVGNADDGLLLVLELAGGYLNVGETKLDNDTKKIYMNVIKSLELKNNYERVFTTLYYHNTLYLESLTNNGIVHA